MKKLFDTNTQSFTTDTALLLGRIVIAGLMLSHGLPKMMMLISGQPVQFPSVMGMGAELSLALAVFAEVVCSVFILAGFATRIAAVPLIITMLVAVFSVHAADEFAKKEPAVIYLALSVILFIAGSGRFSLDHLMQGRPVTDYHPIDKREDPTQYIYQ